MSAGTLIRLQVLQARNHLHLLQLLSVSLFLCSLCSFGNFKQASVLSVVLQAIPAHKCIRRKKTSLGSCEISKRGLQVGALG